MNNALERFQIIGLHGNKNIDVRFDENTLILVGENGSGKTTFLRILFHFLSGHWLSLFQFQFDCIVVTIEGKEDTIKLKDVYEKFKNIDRRSIKNLPGPLGRKVNELIATGRLDLVPIELRRMSDRYGMPFEMMIREFEILEETFKVQNTEMLHIIQKVQNAINAQILYLPTYRRIERELSSIFEDSDFDDSRFRRIDPSRRETEKDYIELVEFGMKDVELAIKNALGNLKEFARESLNNLTLGYLGDVVNQKYKNVGMKEIADVSEKTVHDVLNRIDENILTKGHKEHIFNVINSTRSNTSPDEHSKIISHYFLKLLRFQAALQEKEKPISEFCVLCSEYIVDKQFQ